MRSNQKRGKSSSGSQQQRRQRRLEHRQQRRARRKERLRTGSPTNPDRPKGLHIVEKELAGGRIGTYVYAFKGGPRVCAELDTPEFLPKYNEVIAALRAPPGRERTLDDMFEKFLGSLEFLNNVGKETQREYREKIAVIRERWGTFPKAALAALETRALFRDWRDEIGKGDPKSPIPYMRKPSMSRASTTFKVFRRVLNWAMERGMISANPCARATRIYHGTRIDKIWTLEQEAEFHAKFPAYLWLAVQIAIWTGQREIAAVALRWSDYDGTNLRFRVVKRRVYEPNKWVLIPVGGPLKLMLDRAKQERGIRPGTEADHAILLTVKGRPWRDRQAFSKQFRKVCNRLKFFHDLRYHDLRGTACTRLAIAGCNEVQIASITGHAIGRVKSILELHYLHYNLEIREQAIAKLTAYYGNLPVYQAASPTGRQTGSPTGTVVTLRSAGKR